MKSDPVRRNSRQTVFSSNSPSLKENTTHLCMMPHILGCIEQALPGDYSLDAEMIEHGKQEGTKLEKIFAKSLVEIYKIAHGFNELNDCYSSHEVWREETHSKYKTKLNSCSKP